MSWHKVIIGDSRMMKEVEDQSVHLIITSPPYWQLKDYGPEEQIGYNDTYEDYVNNLNLVWKECHRILHKGCRLCINIGDQFARSVYYGRYKIIPIRTEIIKFCETIGFDYMGAIIWQKVTTCNTTGGATVMGSYPYPRNGILKLDYEFILIFKKYGTAPKVSKERKEQSRLTKEEWNQYFTGHWNFSGERQKNHLAMFPEELPKRLIKMFGFVNDVILDPFLGSGTTSLAAKNLNRNSIGYEINTDYLPEIKRKVSFAQNSLFSESRIEFIEGKANKKNFNDKIAELPYVFNDPIQFDKKVDPKKLQFGSKIDKNSKITTEYYSIKHIISPNLVELNTGLRVKLIGIKVNERKANEAINFLINQTRSQKIFLKFDNQKFDNNNNLYAYLYLKNKTFINAHLIKNNLTFVDYSFDYKYKKKFEKIGEQNV